MRRLNCVCFSLILILGVFSASAAADTVAELKRDFADPPAEWKTRPLWFWNAPPSKEATATLMEGCRDSGYYGFGILPTEKMKLEFMSPAYLDRYEEAVEKAAALGMKMCLYDEFWFPSGAAGGLLAARHPEALGKRLDLLEIEAIGPGTVETNLPAGTLMAAVAMHRQTLQRVNLADGVRQGRLTWQVPEGAWRVMIFTCVPDGARGLVDYLDPDAVGKFVSLTYEQYYRRLGRHFGKTIDRAFYDEPTFHWVQGGRAWTPSFNERFEKEHGHSPALLYPALWHDIGPETASARNALFGFRTTLFARGFAKTLADWCAGHGIEVTGHVDQEEIVNPVGLCGDLIKAFQYQPIPGVDQVFQYGRASKAYKLVSSAAVNYDRSKVMTECYGGISQMPVANLYKEAMDQFAKGINVMVPHAVWYSSTQDVIFQPELSYRTAPYAQELPAYNRYMGRLQRVLQRGRPVAEIAVLYPIAGLQAGYRFGVGTPYEGGVIPPEADYMDVGERLALQVRRDYTFLHPDVLDARCAIEGASLRLRHPTWSQEYRVIVMPGSKVVRWTNLEKIKSFFDRGGAVIATTALPEQSAESGHDAEVRATIAAMFGPGAPRTNDHGGRAVFLPKPTAAALQAALDEALPVGDVRFEPGLAVAGGNLSCLHKRLEDLDVYFIGNSSDGSVDTRVGLRGRLKPELWDPHTGATTPAEFSEEMVKGEPVCRVHVVLPPVRSVFIVTPRSGHP